MRQHWTRPGLHGDLSWRGEKGSDNYYSFYAGKIEKGENDIYYDSDWAYIDGAVDFIKNNSEDKSFCVYLPLLYPHPPYGVEDPWYSSVDRDKIPARISAPENWDDKPSVLSSVYQRQGLQGWTEERWTELRATYLGMCSRIDYQFGLIVDALKDTGVYDDTAIFFFSDHGDFTGDYGLVEKTQNTFEDCLTNVPFIIKPPADVEVKPGVRDSLVELIDFPATVEELTGINFDYTHFGSSLLSVISGDSIDHRDAVFCEGGRLKGERHCMELKSGSSCDPEGLYWPRSNLQQRIPEHSKAVMVTTDSYKYVRRLYEKDELYDLKCDPQELSNLIDQQGMESVLNELKDRLVTFYLETGDVVPHETDER